MTTRARADQYCTFWVDQMLFAVAVTDVQEVLRRQQTTAVPLAGRAVHGLMNLRGQIVTAVDLRSLLGLGARPPDAPGMKVVLRSRNEIVALLVDEVGEVVETAGRRLDPVPVTFSREMRGVVEGVILLPEQVMLVIDTDALADADSSPVRRTAARAASPREPS